MPRGAEHVLGAQLVAELEGVARASSGWKTSWTMPVRSRRSMKIRPPWSRRRWTQPATRASESTRSPQHLPAPGVAVAVRRAAPADALAHASPPLISSTRLPGSTGALLAALHVAQLGAAVGLEDQDAAGADPVGVLELALEAAPGEVDLGREPGVAQLGRPAPAPAARCSSSATAMKASRPGAGSSSSERQQDPLDPGRPADRRRRRAAELLDQAVVAAAAADLRLGAEPVADEGEDRPRVVVEAADQGRVDRVGDAGRVEQRPHLGEVLGVLALEPLDDRRRARHHRPRPLVVGVEGAQRVDVDPLAHVLGELALVRAQVRLQLLQVGAARVERAEAAEPQLDPRHAELGRAGRRAGMITSASASGESVPIASTPSWWNWR